MNCITAKLSKNKLKYTLIFAAIIGIIACILLNLATTDKSTNKSLPNRAQIITSDIFYYSNSVRSIIDGTSFDANKCDDLKIYYTVTDKDSVDNHIAVQTKVRQIESASYGNKQLSVSSYTVDSGQHTYWTLIDLNGVDENSTVTMQLSASDRTSNVNVKTAYLGTASSILLELLYHYLFILIFIAIGIFVGISYTISGCISLIRFKDENAPFVTYLGLFFILLDVWQFSNFQIITSFCNKNAIEIIGNASFMLFCVPIMQFAGATLKKRSKLIDVLSVVMIVNFIVCSLAFSIGNIPFSRTIDLMYILLLLCATITGYVIIKNFIKKKNQNFIFSSIGLLVLISNYIFASIYYLIPDISNINTTTVALTTSSIMFLAFVADSSMSVYGIQTAQKNADYYKEVAFVDNSTNVASKTAYNDYLENADFASLDTVGIVVIDLNNLKKINDTAGHQAGDKIIHSAAIMIKDAFFKTGTTFRYGGDEFVVICENCNKQTMEKLFDDLMYLVDFYNSRYELKLDFAHGIADGDEIPGAMSVEKFTKVFNLADQRMYLAKKDSKTKRE